MFASILKAATKRQSPQALKWVWKQVYNVMSRSWRDDDWRFMNYGYIPESNADFPLADRDEADRAFIGLYHQAVDGLNLKGKRVLEVGSGRGGGSSYLARTYEADEVVGADYSGETVKIARTLNTDVSNLTFEVGDAENLPFPDASFDVVVNIESSHCYANVPAFISEVARVLKPGGTFTWADLRTRTMMEKLDDDLAHQDLKLIHQSELTPGVVRALDAMHDRKESRIQKSWFFKRFMAEFSAQKGSTIYRGLNNGGGRYTARRYERVS